MGKGVNGNLIPPVKGEVRNPKGKPKGTKHISTWIQDMLNDEQFEAVLLDSSKGSIEFKGAPLKAIIMVALQRSIAGDQRWAEWLAKHGYGNTLNVNVSDERKEILSKYGLDNDRQTEEA